MKVRAFDRKIDEVLASNYYKIPRFQRPYSWDLDNITEFWNDIVEDSNVDDDYFIGAIVVFNAGGSYKGVVDGQQRLTTIILLLCALRDKFLEEGLENQSLGVQSLIERTNIDNAKQFVISTESSFPFLQEKILRYEKSDIPIQIKEEEKRIQVAYSKFRENITAKIDKIKNNGKLSVAEKTIRIQNELLEIRTKLLNLKLILVDLDNEDEAYIIFETLNTRGKDLGIADLLKNYISRSITTDNTETDEAKLKWNQIAKNLNTKADNVVLDTFIHHQWLSKYSYTSTKKLYKELKNNIKENAVRAYLDELVADSLLYKYMLEPSGKEWRIEEKEIEAAFEAYSIFKVKQHIPIVLTCFRDYLQGKLNLKQFKNLLTAIENFHFIYTAITGSRSTGGMSQMYSLQAILLAKASSMEEKSRIIKEFALKLHSRIPSEAEFTINFQEILYSNANTKEKSLIRYILEHYDRHLRGGDYIDYSKMTIEHLLPQSSKVSATIYGQLGNLILVDENLNSGRLRNKNFIDKKGILLAAKYPLDEVLIKNDEMTAEVIDVRTKEMAKIAYNGIWRI